MLRPSPIGGLCTVLALCACVGLFWLVGLAAGLVALGVGLGARIWLAFGAGWPIRSPCLPSREAKNTPVNPIKPHQVA